MKQVSLDERPQTSSHIQLQMVPQVRTYEPLEKPEDGDDQVNKKRIVETFDLYSMREKQKILKSLATVTEQDILSEKRQKHGQLRFGDVILLAFTEEVSREDNLAKLEITDAGEAPELKSPPKKPHRNLKEPDHIYRGFLYSDGVTDQGIKVIPYNTSQSQNAANLFKQCLFRIEIQQNCHVNKRAIKLIQQRNEAEERLRKLISEGNSQSDQQMDALKRELEIITRDIEENNKKKQIQDENNIYEQGYRHGNKLTYGTPFQLKHLFSGRYLTLNFN